MIRVAHRRASRRGRLLLGLAVLAMLGAWLLRPAWRGTARDPVIEGRRASDWFREMTRATVRQDRDATTLRRLEARARLLSLGTNVVPFLVEEILRKPPERPFHKALRLVSENLDELFRPAAFPNPAWVREQAWEVFAELSPPASCVEACARPELEGGSHEAFWAALRLLGAARNPGSLPAPWIRARLDRETTPHLRVSLLNALPDPAREYPPPIDLLNQVKAVGVYPLAILLGRYGPAARDAAGWLEREYQDPRHGAPTRVALALALLEVQPEHAAARDYVAGIPRRATFAPHNQLTHPEATALCTVMYGPIHWARHPTALAAIEEVARQEMDFWEPRGMAERALHALERAAPERALPLYLGQMLSTNRPNIRIVAAGAVLRLERTNEAAIRFLATWVRHDSHLARMAAESLGEASPQASEAVEALQAVTRMAGPGGAARASLQRIRNRGIPRVE